MFPPWPARKVSNLLMVVLFIHSFKRVVIPAKIGNTDCNTDTEVVKPDIPLLLSNILKESRHCVRFKEGQGNDV